MLFTVQSVKQTMKVWIMYGILWKYLYVVLNSLIWWLILILHMFATLCRGNPQKPITLSIIARTRPRRNRHPNRLHIVHFIHFADLYQDAQNKPSTARKCHVSATFWGCCNVSLGLKCQCSSCKCKGEDQAKEHLFLSESAKTYLPLR